jgi:mevalonate kinase
LPESGGIISTTKRISPLKEPVKHAQTGKSGGSGDGGCIFRFSGKDALEFWHVNATSARIRENIFHPSVSIEKAKA